MKPKITTILVLMLLPMIGQAQRQQYQQVNDILYTASSDAYAQERCKLDVYYPTDIQDAPVVVWFHDKIFANMQRKSPIISALTVFRGRGDGS